MVLIFREVGRGQETEGIASCFADWTIHPNTKQSEATGLGQWTRETDRAQGREIRETSQK